MTAIVVGAANCKGSTSQIDFQVLLLHILCFLRYTSCSSIYFLHRFQVFTVFSLCIPIFFLSCLMIRLASIGTLGIPRNVKSVVRWR